MSRGILFLMVLFSLPALACNFIIGPDTDATATAISAEIFATMTAMVPTATFTLPPTDTALPTSTATITPTDTPLPSPTITNTPEPTFTPEPTKPTEPTFGPITTYTDETGEDGLLNNPTDEFPAGTTKVYACFDYWAMDSDVRFTLYWFENGKSFWETSRRWEEEEEGSTCWYIWQEKTTGSLMGLPAGNWEVKLYLGNELAQEAKFHIGR